MILTQQSVNTKVSSFTFEQLKYLDKLCSFEITEYVRAGPYKGYQTKRIKLFDSKTNSFPSGLAPRVEKYFKDQQVEVQIEKLRTPEPTMELHFNGELRPYQSQDLHTILKYQRGVIWWVPGAGKSVLICALLGYQGIGPALILTHTKDLRSQMEENIKTFLGVKPGYITEGSMKIKPITIATVQTLASKLEKKDKKALEYVKTVQSVYVDETQHLGAEQMYFVTSSCENAVIKYGFSGTPWRDDNKTMLIEAATGPIIAKRTTKDLVDLGFLVPAKIYILPVMDTPDPSYIKEPDSWENLASYKKKTKESKNYHNIYEKHVTENIYRNEIIAQLTKMCIDKNLTPLLILVRHISHGQYIYDQLKKWLKSEDILFLTGKDEVETRTGAFDQIRNSTLKVLITTQITDEGVNLPSLKSVIIGGAGKSSTKVFQRVGRALRTAPSKTEAYIFDFYDMAPILENHSKRRIRLYKSEHPFVRELSQGQVADFLREGTFNL